MIEVISKMTNGTATRTVSSIHLVRFGSSVFQVMLGSKKGSGQKLLFEVKERMEMDSNTEIGQSIFLEKKGLKNQ